MKATSAVTLLRAVRERAEENHGMVQIGKHEAVAALFASKVNGNTQLRVLALGLTANGGLVTITPAMIDLVREGYKSLETGHPDFQLDDSELKQQIAAIHADFDIKALSVKPPAAPKPVDVDTMFSPEDLEWLNKMEGKEPDTDPK